MELAEVMDLHLSITFITLISVVMTIFAFKYDRTVFGFIAAVCWLSTGVMIFNRSEGVMFIIAMVVIGLGIYMLVTSTLAAWRTR